MNARLRNTLLKYGIAALVGAGMVWAVLHFHGYAGAANAAERYKILCDAFTIPGIVLMLSAVLVWLSNAGSFSGISYAVRYAIRMLIPGMGAGAGRETYAEFVARREEEGGVKGYGFLFITGAAFFLTAIVFLILFYTAG